MLDADGTLDVQRKIDFSLMTFHNLLINSACVVPGDHIDIEIKLALAAPLSTKNEDTPCQQQVLQKIYG